jgi:Xaa-Pro aminopeptidase
MDTRTTPIPARLQSVRQAMGKNAVAALLVPSSDPHLSEYLPERWQGREWLSGFTGSMGNLIVTAQEAALFADSRYWTQAEHELKGSGIELVRVHSGAASHWIDWAIGKMSAGQTLAVDGQVLGLGVTHTLEEALSRAKLLLDTKKDVLGQAWPDRPELPQGRVYEHAQPFAVAPRTQRLALVRDAMRKHGATHHLVSTVDDIAWITSLRGTDVDYNPVFIAHLLVSLDTATLYVGAGKVDPALEQQLQRDGLVVAEYALVAADLAKLPSHAVMLVDPKRVTHGLRQSIAPQLRLIEAINPSTLAKSCKSAAEAAHIREAMIEDGAAMCEFYAWFEAQLAKPATTREALTEISVADRLSAERAKRKHFVGLSFPVIAGYNANGALPHYRASEATNATIEGDGLLLIDSGGQYLGGTTDITRVWPIGQVSAAMKRDYTLVLKGTMALSRTRFPRGTLSPMIDAIARAPLWAESLEFGHGTGHGVGYFLNVHEGPQSISKAVPDATMAMEPGMITSIEPGLYREGHYGIRIENLVLNVAAPTAGFGEFLAFETLTLCPIDTRCIDGALLRADERQWLNDYHATVREKLAPRLSGAALAWLELRTQALA